jgi:hypothetical protein
MRTLQYYLAHRDRSPTVGEFLRRFSGVLLFWTVCAAALAWYFVSIGWSGLAYLCVGVFAGAALREFRQHLWTVRVWPAIVAATDWNRVEDLVARASGRTEPDTPADRTHE